MNETNKTVEEYFKSTCKYLKTTNDSFKRVMEDLRREIERELADLNIDTSNVDSFDVTSEIGSNCRVKLKVNTDRMTPKELISILKIFEDVDEAMVDFEYGGRVVILFNFS